MRHFWSFSIMFMHETFWCFSNSVIRVLVGIPIHLEYDHLEKKKLQMFCRLYRMMGSRMIIFQMDRVSWLFRTV